MPFFSDVLKVAGVITGAALASTGVASPFGAAIIGAAVSVPANLGASAIDRADARSKLDKAGSEAKREVDDKARIVEEKVKNKQKKLQAQAEHQRTQAGIANRILELCAANNIQPIPGLLQQLDDRNFEEPGLGPLAACETQVIADQVAQMIADEVTRREELLRRRPRP